MQYNRFIPYSGYFSRGNIFVKVVILAISWKYFCGRAVCIKTTPIDSWFFVGKYFVVCLSTTKTTKILPPPPKNTRYTVVIRHTYIHLYSLLHLLVCELLNFCSSLFISPTEHSTSIEDVDAFVEALKQKVVSVRV